MNLSRPQKLLSANNTAGALAALPPAGESKDPRVEIIRSKILSAEGRNTDAAETLHSLVAARPDYAPGHTFLGIALWDMAQPEQALTHFDRTLELQKQNDLARSYRALCLCAIGQREAAAKAWNSFGFSDNAMFRVRVAEFVERAWLLDQSFMGETVTGERVVATSPSIRNALRRFYKRDFSGMLNYLPPPGTENELEAFLAATAHEMLRQYQPARDYIAPLDNRRAEWPDPLIALNARLLVRHGHIAAAARDFAGIVVMGPEDFGLNYYMGIVCLAYDRAPEARQYFLRAFTNYMVDTLEFQWWQLEQVLLNPDISAPVTTPSTAPQ